MDEFSENERRWLNSFRYHQPSPEQVERISRVRKACIACAEEIIRAVPPSADQTVAIRTLHEAMMTANKAIVCEGS
jgi:hypothetical protein